MAYSITHGLCTLADVKAALNITDTHDDDRISLAIDAASRLIEARCNRRFWQDATVSTRKFVSNDPWLVETDDISTTVGLIVETDYAGDGTFGTTWDTSDYQTEPINGIMQGLEGWPVTKIRAIRSLYFPVWGGISYPKPYTQALVRITAKWGWPSIPTQVVKAAVVQSISLFRADDTPFGATPFAETGIVRMKNALHPTAELLLTPYREDPVLVA
jgi:hypothetical protein